MVGMVEMEHRVQRAIKDQREIKDLQDQREIKDLLDQREKEGIVEIVVMEYRLSREMLVLVEIKD